MRVSASVHLYTHTRLFANVQCVQCAQTIIAVINNINVRYTASAPSCPSSARALQDRRCLCVISVLRFALLSRPFPGRSRFVRASCSIVPYTRVAFVASRQPCARRRRVRTSAISHIPHLSARPADIRPTIRLSCRGVLFIRYAL